MCSSSELCSASQPRVERQREREIQRKRETQRFCALCGAWAYNLCRYKHYIHHTPSNEQTPKIHTICMRERRKKPKEIRCTGKAHGKEEALSARLRSLRLGFFSSSVERAEGMGKGKKVIKTRDVPAALVGRRGLCVIYSPLRSSQRPYF